MEQKINIAELLKDCPKGMELYSPIFGELKFNEVNTINNRILVVQQNDYIAEFESDGRLINCKNGECLLFPSKGKTTWDGFVPPCKFKDGDIIKHKESGLYCTLGEYAEGILAYHTNIGLSLTYKDLEQWELVPNKFDITTLKPFDKVLVRDNNEQFWTCDWFSFHDTKQVYPFACVGHYVSQCIPYEENQHLLGTTDDCDEYFKTW